MINKLFLSLLIVSPHAFGAAMSRAMGTMYPLYVSEMEDSLIAMQHYHERAFDAAMAEYWETRIELIQAKLARARLVEKTRLKVLFDIERARNTLNH